MYGTVTKSPAAHSGTEESEEELVNRRFLQLAAERGCEISTLFKKLLNTIVQFDFSRTVCGEEILPTWVKASDRLDKTDYELAKLPPEV